MEEYIKSSYTLQESYKFQTIFIKHFRIHPSGFIFPQLLLHPTSQLSVPTLYETLNGIGAFSYQPLGMKISINLEARCNSKCEKQNPSGKTCWLL